MLISWDDVDRTEVAGWHPVKRLGITVNIRQQEIETWKDDPHGRFMVVEFSPLAGPEATASGNLLVFGHRNHAG